MNSDDDADLALGIALSLKEEASKKASGGGGAKQKHARDARPQSSTTTHPGTKRKERKRERDVGEDVEVLVISSDEDEELVPAPRAKMGSKAIATKQAASSKPTTSSNSPKNVEVPNAVDAAPTAVPAAGAATSAGAGPLSFLGDRAQMERERVARQKRLRGPSPPPAPPASSGGYSSDSDAESSGSGSEGSARKRARLDSTATKKGAGKSLNGSGKEDGRRTFPAGAVLRIETQHATRSETPGIRLTEVLGPRDELAFAVLAAFVVDPAWLYGFFEPETPVVLVTDPQTSGGGGSVEDDGGPTLKNIFPNWIRVCPPLHDGRGCMHMKYMLLFSKTGGLRLIVSSANLVPHDWRDVENYLFIQDLPPVTVGEDTIRLRTGEKPHESFAAVLVGALRETGVEEALMIMGKQGHTTLPLPTLAPSAPVSKHSSGSKNAKHRPSPLEAGWDWTRVRAALVPSVPGRWTGWAGERAVLGTGQARLLRAVQTLGCGFEGGGVKGKAKGNGGGELELDCLTSSIGTYTPPWLAAFRLCAGGRARGLEAWLDRGRKKTPQQGPTRILFPTLETVRGTTAGEPGAGTVFCRRAQWTKISALLIDGKAGLGMADARSRSGPVGTHTKMILGTLKGPAAGNGDEDESVTESETEESEVEVVEAPRKEKDKEAGRPHAWLYVGSHNFTPSAWGTLSGNGFNPVLNVTNYELGVVLRLETPADADAAVAWERPARRYIKGDVPWIQDESPYFMQ